MSSEIVCNSHVVVIQLGGAYVEHILPKHHKIAKERGFYQPEYPVALVCTFYRFSVCRRSWVVGSAVWTCYEVLQFVTEREVVCDMVFAFEYKYIRRYYIFGFAYYHSRVVLLKQISGVERERFGYFFCQFDVDIGVVRFTETEERRSVAVAALDIVFGVWVAAYQAIVTVEVFEILFLQATYVRSVEFYGSAVFSSQRSLFFESIPEATLYSPFACRLCSIRTQSRQSISVCLGESG